MAADIEEAITAAGLAIGVQLKSEQQKPYVILRLAMMRLCCCLPCTANCFVLARCQLFSTVSVGNQAL